MANLGQRHFVETVIGTGPTSPEGLNKALLEAGCVLLSTLDART